MNFYKFEDKLKNWIETHRFVWCFILFGLGLSLGFFFPLLLGADIRQGVGSGLGYGSLLVIIELTAGGGGID